MPYNVNPYIVRCTIYGVQCTPYNVKPYDVLRTSYGVHGIVTVHLVCFSNLAYSVRCTTCIIRRTSYAVQCTIVHIIQRAMYYVRRRFSNPT